MSGDSSNLDAPTPGAAPGGDGGPTYRVPGVDTGEPGGGGALPGVLRFFVVPLALVGISVAIFAGLGSLVGRGPPSTEDLLRNIVGGGKNARWQAAQELSNQVHRGDLDLRREPRTVAALATAFRDARAAGDDPRILQHLAVLLGRSKSDGALEPLREALADGNPDVRIYAVAALLEHGHAAAADAILPRLDDLDAGVRAIAAYAVADLAARSGSGKAEWRGALGKALVDPSLDVQWNAALGLARLGSDEGADLVWSMLHRDYVRASLRPGDGGGLLSRAGTDPESPAQAEEFVVRNALSAAYRLKDRSMVEGARALAAGDPSDGVRDWAMRTVAVLEREIAEKGPVPPRAWAAMR